MAIIQAEVMFNSLETIDNELDNSKDAMQINTGTYFKHSKKLIASRDQIYLTISVPLPDFNQLLDLLAEDRYLELEDTCQIKVEKKSHSIIHDLKAELDSQAFIKESACAVYKNVQKVFASTLLKTRTTAADKLKILTEYIPGLEDLVTARFPDLITSRVTDTVNRPKRFIPVIAAGISLAMTGIQTGLSIYRTHKLRNRLKAMGKDIKHLLKRTDKNSRAILNLQGTFSAFVTSVGNQITAIHEGMERTDRRLSNLTEIVAENIVKISYLNGNDKLLAYSTTTQVNQLLMLDYLHELADDTDTLLTRLVDACHLLEMGQLPPQLINIPQLDRFLQQLAQQLLTDLPDFEIASTLSSEYYNTNSVIWGIADSNIMINIPIMITEKPSTPFELYQIQTFYVPTNVRAVNEQETDPQPTSYTKIQPEYQYIAVKRDVYILITEQILEECTLLKGNLYCSELLIHTQKTEASCLSALFYREGLDVVTKHCPIMYYHNMIPNPSVFEDADHIYLANVDNSWRVICQHDDFPHSVEGSSFTTISKKSLCGCEIIIGQNHYLPTTRTGCKQLTVNLEMKYPVNSIMLYNLRDRIKNLTLDFQYYQAQKENLDYSIPELKIQQLVDNSKILYERPQTGIPLDKVLSMIQSDSTAYLTADDLIVSQSHISNWFDGDSKENTFAFISGLISVICFISLLGLITIYCTSNRRITALVASLTAQIGRHPANAYPALSVQPDQAHDEFLFFEIRFRVVIVIAMIVSYLLFKLIKYLNNKYFQYRMYIPQMSSNARHYKTHLFIEIFTDEDKEILYLQSIRTTLLNITLNPDTKITVKELNRVGLNGQLKIDWTKGYYHILKDKFLYPEVISVPFFKYRKVQGMMKTVIYARLLIQQDVFYSLDGLYSRQQRTNPTKRRSFIKTNGSLDSDSEARRAYQFRKAIKKGRTAKKTASSNETLAELSELTKTVHVGQPTDQTNTFKGPDETLKTNFSPKRMVKTEKPNSYIVGSPTSSRVPWDNDSHYAEMNSPGSLSRNQTDSTIYQEVPVLKSNRDLIPFKDILP